MRILFIGDIVGQRGRETVKAVLPPLKKEKKIQFVIANGENLAHGKGATVDTIQEMQSFGVDFFTSGNHIWDTKEILTKLNDKQFPLIRPANYPEGNPGRGYDVVQAAMMKNVAIINLQGRVFMPEGLNSPFTVFDTILQEIKHNRAISAIVVDFHAEATSEKHALRHYIDGKVSALLGTHTHVQTSDAFVTDQGMAFITDVGMTGVYHNSVIGVDKNHSIDFFLLANNPKWDMAKGESLFQAVLLDVDDTTQKATSIETLCITVSET